MEEIKLECPDAINTGDKVRSLEAYYIKKIKEECHTEDKENNKSIGTRYLAILLTICGYDKLIEEFNNINKK